MNNVPGIRKSQINLYYAEALDAVVEQLGRMREDYQRDLASYEEQYKQTLKNLEDPEYTFNSFNDWGYIETIRLKAKIEYINSVEEELLKGKIV